MRDNFGKQIIPLPTVPMVAQVAAQVLQGHLIVELEQSIKVMLVVLKLITMAAAAAAVLVQSVVTA